MAKKSSHPTLVTLHDRLAWAYANLAAADAALAAGSEHYKPLHFMIRARLFKGLRNRTMSVRSLFADERWKIFTSSFCAYCGDDRHLSLDHVLARNRGGLDSGDNLIVACRSCNSSKGELDTVVWAQKRGMSLSVPVWRRYLKLAFQYSEDKGLLDMPLCDVERESLPFSLDLLPIKALNLEATRMAGAKRN